MWPWEHAAVAYIGYSIVSRLRDHAHPSAGSTLAVLVGSQLPDLIDKPLAWWLHLLPSGRSLGHSLLFALPVCLLVILVAHQRSRTELSIAFGIGYLSHLPGDVFYPALVGGRPEYRFLLYPVVPREGYVEPGVLGKLIGQLGKFIAFLQTPRGTLYLGAELALIGIAVWLWLADGKPGLGAFTRRVRRSIPG